MQWYKFNLTYADIQSIQDGTDADQSWSTIFDIDYAGGVSRPDLTLSVFDSLGNLIYVSRNSNVIGRSTHPHGQRRSNLSTGSSSPLDPFLGSVQLPVGTSKTYYVAISSDAALPADLDQTFLPAANSPEALANPSIPTATNLLERLQPIDSVTRIVEDHIDPTVPTTSTDTLAGVSLNPDGGYTTTGGTTITPNTPSILPITDGVPITNPNTSQPGTVINQLSANIVPYALANVPLLVAADPGNAAISTLYTVNPQSGATVKTIGTLAIPNAVNTYTSTITMASDGILYGDETADPGSSSTNGGRLMAIDPTNGTEYVIGTDNIAAASLPLAEPPPNPPTFPNNSVTTDFNPVGAIAMLDTGLGYLPEGSGNKTHYVGFEAVTDIFGMSHLFEFDPTDGNATGGKTSLWNPIPTDSQGAFGPFDGTMYMNPSAITTSGGYETTSDVGPVTGMSFVNNQGEVMIVPAGNAIQSGQTFSVGDISHSYTFQFILPGGTLTAGDIAVPLTGTESADGVAAAIKAAIQSTDLGIFGFETTSFSLVGQPSAQTYMALDNAFSASAGNSPVSFYNTADVAGTTLGSELGNLGNTLYGVTSTGQFITIDYAGVNSTGFSQTGIVTNINTFNNTGAQHQWAGLTSAPQDVDVNGDGVTGDLDGCLFAATTNGDIYCIDTLGRYTGIGGNPGTPGQPGLIEYIPGLHAGDPSVPIFPLVNGKVTDHVSTGIQNVNGLAFSQSRLQPMAPDDFGRNGSGARHQSGAG